MIPDSDNNTKESKNVIKDLIILNQYTKNDVFNTIKTIDKDIEKLIIPIKTYFDVKEIYDSNISENKKDSSKNKNSEISNSLEKDFKDKEKNNELYNPDNIKASNENEDKDKDNTNIYEKLLSLHSYTDYKKNLEILPKLKNTQIFNNIKHLQTLLSNDNALALKNYKEHSKITKIATDVNSNTVNSELNQDIKDKHEDIIKESDEEKEDLTLFDRFLNIVSSDTDDDETFFTKENIKLILELDPPSKELINSILAILQFVTENLSEKTSLHQCISKIFNSKENEFSEQYLALRTLADELFKFIANAKNSNIFLKLIKNIKFSDDKRQNLQIQFFCTVLIKELKHNENFSTKFLNALDKIYEIYKPIAHIPSKLEEAKEKQDNLDYYFIILSNLLNYIKSVRYLLKNVEYLIKLFTDESTIQILNSADNKCLEIIAKSATFLKDLIDEMTEQINKLKQMHENFYRITAEICNGIIEGIIDPLKILDAINNFTKSISIAISIKMANLYNNIKGKIDINQVINYIKEKNDLIKEDISKFIDSCISLWKGAAKVYAADMERQNKNRTGENGFWAGVTQHQKDMQDLQPWNK